MSKTPLEEAQHGDGEESYRRYTEALAALIRALKGNVSAEIRRIRKKLKLTQADLADAFGLGKVDFSSYKRGNGSTGACRETATKIFSSGSITLYYEPTENGRLCEGGLSQLKREKRSPDE